MKDKLFPVERLAVSGNNRSLVKALLRTPKLKDSGYEPSLAFLKIICRTPLSDVKELILARQLNQDSFETVIKMLMKMKDCKSLKTLIKKYDFYLNNSLLEGLFKLNEKEILCTYYSRWFSVMKANAEYYRQELEMLKKHNLIEELQKRYPKCDFSLDDI